MSTRRSRARRSFSRRLVIEVCEPRLLLATDLSLQNIGALVPSVVNVSASVALHGVAVSNTATGPVYGTIPEAPPEHEHQDHHDHDRPPEPVIPIDPEIIVGESHSTALGGNDPIEPQAEGDFQFYRNTDDAPAGGSFSATNEPSAGTIDNVVFQTGNWYASVSGNNGTSFTYIDPYTTFPSTWGGFCCDQQAANDPIRDMMLWYLQYNETGDTVNDTNGVRIARANTTAEVLGNTWTYWDFTPASFGLGNGLWLDFPQMQLTDSFAYFTSNVFTTTADAYSTSVFWRIALSELEAGGSVNYGYIDFSLGTMGLPAGATDTMYAATVLTSNSIRVRTWADSSGTIFTDDVGGLNTTFFADPNNGITHNSFDNNGFNWTAFSNERVLTGWVSGDNLGFMWNSMQGTDRPMPFVRAVVLNKNTKALISQPDIWHDTVTWHYPAFAPNGRGHVAGTVGYNNQNGPVGTQILIDDDFNGDPAVSGWEAHFGALGADGPMQNRWGDYLDTDADDNFPNTWIGTGFSHDAGTTTPSFFWFGRERDAPPPEDAYEPNDSFAGAYNLGTRGYFFAGGLTIHDINNADYYRFTAGNDGTADINVYFSHAGGDVDLAVYDANQNFIGGSASVDDNESVSIPVARGQSYYVHVYGYAGAIHRNYSLEINAPAVPIDFYEPNDDFAGAYNVKTRGYFFDSGLTIHAAGNGDYFRFTAGGTGQADINVYFSHAAGDIDAQVYDSNQAFVGGSFSVDDDEFVSIPVVQGQIYYVQVYGYAGAVHPNYSLEINAPLPPPDIYEANDSFTGAYNLGTRGYFYDSGLTIHDAFNDDYFRFTAGGTGQADINVYFSHDAGDVDVAVYDSNQAFITGSFSVDDDEFVSIPVVQGQTYYVQVYGYAGALHWYYGLEINAPFPSPDIYEANDSFAGAYDLGSRGYFYDAGLTIHDAFNDDYFSFTAGVTGQADINVYFSHDAGDLDVAVYDGSQTFINGSFSVDDDESVSVPVVGGETYYVQVYGYAGALHWYYSLEINVVPTTHPNGDYNDDGTVDTADYVLYRKYEGTVTVLPNDPIGGVIGQAQYDQWRANFGATSPGAGGGAGDSSGVAIEKSPASVPATLSDSKVSAMGAAASLTADFGLGIEASAKLSAAYPVESKEQVSNGPVADVAATTSDRQSLDDALAVPGSSHQAPTRHAIGSHRLAEELLDVGQRDTALLAWVASQSSGDESSAEDGAETFARWKADEDSVASLLGAIDSAFETLLADAA